MMAFEMHVHAALIVAAVWLIVFVLLSRHFMTDIDVDLMRGYLQARLWGPSNVIVHVTIGGVHFEATAKEMTLLLMRNIEPLLGKIKSAAGLSCFALFLWPIITGYFKRQGAKLTAPKYLQGSRFATVREVKKSVRRAGGGNIAIGTDVKMAKNIETQHLIGFGRSGSGKTTIMLQIIEAQQKRDAKAVILDSIKGDYMSRFYDPSRDLIFNPLDERHVGWSIMRELRTYMDVDAIAQSLIPQSHNEDAFWHNAARAVFSGCLHNLNLEGEKRNKAIWDFLQQDGAQVTASLKKTKQPGWKYIEDASSKQAGSVFATLQQFVHPFEYMQQSDGDFTIDSWLNDPKGGFIFVTSYADIQDTLRSVLSLFIDLVGRRLLSMPDDKERRVFFDIDELGSLQRLPSLIPLLTLSRSKGGACVLFNQEVSSLDRIYTKDHRATIVNNCGSKIIMNVKDPLTAEFCSQAIGQAEVEEIQVTNTVGPSEVREAISFSRSRQIKSLVMPSAIMYELRPYDFYLMLANQQVLKTQTKKMDHLPKIAPEFLMRPELRLDYIAHEHARLAAEAAAKQNEAAQERSEIRNSEIGPRDKKVQEKREGMEIKELDF